MDGTLAIFTPALRLETLYEQGCFYSLNPIDSVLNAIKIIIHSSPEIEVNILSSVLTDSKFAIDEKHAWLDKYLPEIPKERRIFPPAKLTKNSTYRTGLARTIFYSMITP